MTRVESRRRHTGSASCIRSLATMIRPEKFFFTSSVQLSSVTRGSSPGTKWLSTSTLTPAAAAMRPTSSVRGVALQQMFLQRRAVLGFGHEAIDRGQVEAFVHQYVGALGELCELGIVIGIAGEHDGAVRRLELVGEIIRDRRMRRAERRHFHVWCLQHHAVIGDIPGDQELARIGAALVLDPGLDIELVQLPIGPGHRLDSLGAERLDRRR